MECKVKKLWKEGIVFSKTANKEILNSVKAIKVEQ